MQQITVSLGQRSYPIEIGPGLLREARRRLEALPVKRWAVIADDNTAALYAGALDLPVYTFPAGEGSKRLAVYEDLCRRLLADGFTRQDGIAALGGGVTGDLAGFIAGTLLRGVALAQLPTSLLAQVDSSVGGKTGLDLPEGKNLIGCFYQPRLVLADTACLATLPRRQLSSGMAEVIKYGCIADRAFFHLLYHCHDRAAVMARIEEVLHTCCAIKAAIVAKDERDTGLRMLLNFGHTLGHAYEKAGNYETCTHGQAVAAGMCRAAELGVRLGMTPGELPLLLKTVVRNFGLPDHIPCTMEDYQSAIGLDKKGSGSKISVILLTELGQAQAVPIEKAQLFQLIEEIEKESL